MAKATKEMIEKVNAGSFISDKELVILIEFFTDLTESLKLVPVYVLSYRDASYKLNTLLNYKDARDLPDGVGDYRG